MMGEAVEVSTEGVMRGCVDEGAWPPSTILKTTFKMFILKDVLTYSMGSRNQIKGSKK